LETFRCPTCLFVLTGPEQSRCPSCHKRLRRRGRPIVLGGRTKSPASEPPGVDLVYAELTEVSETTSRHAEPRPASLLITPRVAPPAYEVPPAVGGVAPDDTAVGGVAHDNIAPVVPLPFMNEAASVKHTTIFAPSQFDPEMRQVLDDLYRKARAEVDDEYEHDAESQEADDASA
jgi:hypothetical protein